MEDNCDKNVDSQTEEQRPVNIVKINENHEYVLDESLLDSIFLDKKVKNLKVMILSVAGAFRKGKSFILNFFIQYASLLEQKSPALENWLEDGSQLIKGFKWRGGSERETTGIWLWSKPFIIDHPTYNKVALFFMDTQGAFDSQSTVKDCATIFALSTMISSVQIYNISSNIQEDDLQHLQLFTEYGRLALESSHCKPFQKLQFLVRDWCYPYEYDYGNGSDFLTKKLSATTAQHQELQSVRNHILSCFENVSCFLLPHPGMNVSTNPNFNGQISEIDQTFRKHVKTFVPDLLAGDNIKLKCMNGSDILCRDFPLYFKAYIKIFGKDVLPEPKSMLMATAEANNLSALASAKDFYNSEMEKICGGSSPYLPLDTLKQKHNEVFNKSMDHFNSFKKMGGDSYSSDFISTLKEELENSLNNFIKINQSKDLIRVLRVPMVCSVIAIVTYVFAIILDIIGLDGLSSILSIFTIGTIIMALTWVYLRISGNYPDIIQIFDLVSDNMWEMVIVKLFTLINSFIVQSNFAPKPPTTSTNSKRIKTN